MEGAPNETTNNNKSTPAMPNTTDGASDFERDRDSTRGTVSREASKHEVEDADVAGGCESSESKVPSVPTAVGMMQNGTKRHADEQDSGSSSKRVKTEIEGGTAATSMAPAFDKDSPVYRDVKKALAEALAKPEASPENLNIALRTYIYDLKTRVPMLPDSGDTGSDTVECFSGLDLTVLDESRPQDGTAGDEATLAFKTQYNKAHNYCEHRHQTDRALIRKLQAEVTELRQKLEHAEESFEIPEDLTAFLDKRDLEPSPMWTVAQYAYALQLLEQVLLSSTRLNTLSDVHVLVDTTRLSNLGCSQQDIVCTLIAKLQRACHEILYTRYYSDVSCDPEVNKRFVEKSRFLKVADTHPAAKKCAPGSVGFESTVLGDKESKFRRCYAQSWNDVGVNVCFLFTYGGKGPYHLPYSVQKSLIRLRDIADYLKSNDHGAWPTHELLLYDREVMAEHWMLMDTVFIPWDSAMAEDNGGMVPYSDGVLSMRISYRNYEKNLQHRELSGLTDQDLAQIGEDIRADDVARRATWATS